MNTKAKTQNGKRILFANFPADGHFNPLTGLAVYLDNAGYDVRWYSSESYAAKLKKLQIRHYPFKKALEVQDGNFDQVFPERARIKSQVKKLRFDIINAFIKRAPEYYDDLLEIYNDFPFDLLIADCAFTAVPFVKDLMKIPVISIGVMPLTETSRDLPPAGLGMAPSYSFFGKIRQSLLRTLADKVIFGAPNRVMHDLFDQYNISHSKQSVFDMLIQKSDLLLQSGTPGFEYYRSDMSPHIRFIGALLPFSKGRQTEPWFDARLTTYKKIVVLTQGTVEKDVSKIIVPALEALKNTDILVVCTTGGSQTGLLKKKYDHPNIIIEDFIPFDDVMKYAQVYITNGGYGGVMLGIRHKLPLLVAGSHEGKNEINARVGYFELGINLKTEKPAAWQIKKAVNQLLLDPKYRNNVEKLSREFNRYDPAGLVHEHVKILLGENSLSNVA